MIALGIVIAPEFVPEFVVPVVFADSAPIEHPVCWIQLAPAVMIALFELLFVLIGSDLPTTAWLAALVEFVLLLGIVLVFAPGRYPVGFD